MIDWRIQELADTASTNDDVKKAALDGAAEGLVVWAHQQAKGRGRQGRLWESPIGNLYCSILLRPPLLFSEWGLFSFVAALAVKDTILTFAPNAFLTLKWPNDVLVDHKKISGILLETIEHGIIIGVGINVQHHPSNSPYPTTSLQAIGTNSQNLRLILDTLLKHLHRWETILKTEGFSPVRLAWLDNAMKGDLVVRLPQETLQGRFIDLNQNGHLCLHLADGSERAIASGEVFSHPKDNA